MQFVVHALDRKDALAIAGVWESIDISRITIHQNKFFPIMENA